MSQPQYSPGLEGVIAGETAICSLDGGLFYRGYAVETLAQRATFDEVAFLLLHGELPNSRELSDFRQRLAVATLPSELLECLRRLPREAAPMDVMRTGTSLLAHWDPLVSENDHASLIAKAERLVAQLPQLLAAWNRIRRGEEPLASRPELSLSENLGWMLSGEMPGELWIRAMDATLVMYAEHEFNASTFTARATASTLSDLHSAITSGIGALKGPLHGGANERVMDVLMEVGSPERAEAWVREALATKRRIMGFGHRVYKLGDPRAKYLKPLCVQLAAASGHAPMEEMADTIERIVTAEKKLPPNLDWPSARLYYYMGLPVDLYTPLFVVSRVTGWSAHAIEQLGNNRLIRPLANYIGPAPRAFQPISERHPDQPAQQ